MINNLNYLPESIRKSLANNGGDQLKNLHFLPEMWDNPINNGKWNKLTDENKNAVFNKSKEYYKELEQPLNQEISRFPSETKTMIADLYKFYYTETFAPHIFGVYFDGKAFLEDIKKMNEAQAKQTTLNYWEAFTAVAMCGALDASLSNSKMQPLLQPITLNTNNRNKLRLVVNYMRVGNNFSTLSKKEAELNGIGGTWWKLGVAYLRYEISKYRGNNSSEHTLEDASGAFEYPVQWLEDKYQPQLENIEQMNNVKRLVPNK